MAANIRGKNDGLETHYNRLLSESSVKTIQALHELPKLKDNMDISQIKWPKLGSLSLMEPKIEENKDPIIKLLKNDPQVEQIDLSDLEKQQNFSDFQFELYILLKSYKDLLYTNVSPTNCLDIQQVYTLHILHHLMNSRSKIISNNKVFEKKALSENIIHDDPVLRDQGFTRARILFLLPFRHSALRLGKTLSKMLSNTHTATHMDRFIQEFGDEFGDDSTIHSVPSDGNKPSDYYHIFHGNTDDAFRVGLKLTKRNLKFFADFYDSDIIIASPLGLKTIITPDEHQAVSSNESEQIIVNGDKDFLSSIEIIVLDQADVFLMQNWEHVLDIMQHINQMPIKPRKMDVSRIRPWHLENWSKYYRQIAMFSSISVPLIHSFFQSSSFNYEGYLTLKHHADTPKAKLITSNCRQQFLYYSSASIRDAPDYRFSFFIKHVLPKFTGLGNADEIGSNDPLDHTLILVSSYFDYVRLRNYFRREKLSFTQVCEYTDENKVSKARQLFFFGARQFLIYTERCHFYHRYKIKGVRRVIFYEPPVYPHFYTEIADMLTPELQGKKFVDKSTQFTVTTLFSDHDTLQFGAIIGYGNAVKLIQNKKSIT